MNESERSPVAAPARVEAAAVRRARHRTSAIPLAWAYAALIVYASLSPFAGWKQPANAPPFFGFGHLPWVHWWTGFDVISNLIGYMPFSALVFGALVRSGRAVWPSVWWTVFAGTLLSFSMESLQNWLPQRVPSVLDWLLNTGGTLLGLAVAVCIRALGGVERWQVLRDRWFIRHSGGGLALLLLWPVGLLFPAPVPFGVGQVVARLQEAVAAALDGTPWSDWVEGWEDAFESLTPLSRSGEFMTIVLGLLAPCVLAYSVMRPGRRRFWQAPAALAAGVAATTLSTALSFGPDHAWAWLTPAVIPALVAGAVVALALAFMPPRGAAGVGLVVVMGLVALVAQAPTDPYYAASLQGWEQGRFIRFHGLAQWVGWLWPYAVLIYLLMRVAARESLSAESVRPPS